MRRRRLREDWVNDDWNEWQDVLSVYDYDNNLERYKAMVNEWDWVGKESLSLENQLEVAKVLDAIDYSTLKVVDVDVDTDNEYVSVAVKEPTKGHVSWISFADFDEEGYPEDADWAQYIFYTNRWHNYWGADDDRLEYAIQSATNSEGMGLFDYYLDVAEGVAIDAWRDAWASENGGSY